MKLMSFDGYLHLNGVILAGVLTDFYRDYNSTIRSPIVNSRQLGFHLMLTYKL